MKDSESKIIVANEDVPIWHKQFLKIDEAALLFNIGENKIRELTDRPGCEFVIFVGHKRLIKSEKFAEYLNSENNI